MSQHKKRTQADINFLNGAKANLQKKFAPPPTTPREVLEAKAKTFAMTVHTHIQPIIKAGGARDDSGKQALAATIFTMFVQGFDSKLFTKEELIHLCAIVHTEAMMQSIEADPGAKGTPDLLAGV